MSDLKAKANAVSALLFAVLYVIRVAVPLSYTTLMLVALLTVLSAISYLLATMKNGMWHMFAWVWSAFCTPYISTQILLFEYIAQHVTVESLIWVLAVYLAVFPIIMAIMFKHLKLVVAQMY